MVANMLDSIEVRLEEDYFENKAEVGCDGKESSLHRRDRCVF